MAEGAIHGSFRDPAGFVFVRDGVVHRQVNFAHRPHYDALMSSGLYQALVDRGLMVSHEEVRAEPPRAGGYVVLRPQQIGFVSFPYEWCFGQLRAAALATLEIQRIALEHGMSLRDASAYNIQFREGRPVLIDTLSFEQLREGVPWVAYGQFCRHFLAPLALMRYRDLGLGRLSQIHLDGVPLALAAGLLPWRARLRPGLFIHLHLHARSQRRFAGAAPPRPGRFGLQVLRGLVESLQGAVRKLDLPEQSSAWSDYYEGDSYSPEAAAHKQELVEAFLDEVQPAEVWDLGANTGRFARLASDRGIPTVAFEADPACVEADHRRVVAEGETKLLPLVMDLTNPSPGVGWRNRERLSLAERGPADLVMALALVHHLAIGNNLPLPEVAAFLRELVGRYLIVEFVPKSDPKVELMLRSREDIFPHYTKEAFEEALQTLFSVDRHEPIKDSDRVLYLLRAR